MKTTRLALLVAAIVLVAVVTCAFFVLEERRDQTVVPDTPAVRAEPTAALDVLEAPPSTTPAQPEAVVDSRRVQAAARELEIVVVDQHSARIADAGLASCPQSNLLAVATTAGHGSARFRELEGSGEYAMAATGWAVARGRVELGSGRPTLALAAGGT